MTGPRRGLAYNAHGTTYDPDQHWTTRAACRTEDPELFWPAAERNPWDQQQIEKAKAVCNACPVKADCLEWALANEPDEGVWGAHTGRERSELRARRQRHAPKPSRDDTPLGPPTARAGCGTANGHRNHDRNHEQRCQPCETARLKAKEAAAQVAADRARQRRAKAPAPPCGTRKAYDRHLALGEPTCATCKAAKAAQERAVRLRETDTLIGEIQHLLDLGADLHQAARTLDRTPKALEKALQRRGQHHLLWQLRRTAA